MDHNVKLELAKQYLRERGKYILEQDKSDPNRFQPTTAVATNVQITMREYVHVRDKKTAEASTQTVRLFDRKLRFKK
jgi:hypothetical protein